jgi:phosphoglycolate phosphatase
MVHLQCGARKFDRIRAIIFDKDGTLADSQHYLWQQAHKRVAMLQQGLGDRWSTSLASQLLSAWRVGHDRIDPMGLMAVGSRRDNELVTAGYLTPLGLAWVEALTVVQDAFATASQAFPRKEQFTPIAPGVQDLIHRLHDAGLQLAILSADTTANVQAFAATYGLADALALCMGVQEGMSKPDPRLLQLACTQLGVQPGETLVIGDSAADIELAKRGGAAGAIGVTWGWSERFEIANADVMLHDTEQIQVLTRLGRLRMEKA